MPKINFQINDDETQVPTGPHLVLVTSMNPPTGTPIEVGAKMFIVMDPNKPDGILPVFLAKVSWKEIAFRCNCGNPSCTSVLRYRCHKEGHHHARLTGG